MPHPDCIPYTVTMLLLTLLHGLSPTPMKREEEKENVSTAQYHNTIPSCSVGIYAISRLPLTGPQANAGHLSQSSEQC